jgi:hypothetical protein
LSPDKKSVKWYSERRYSGMKIAINFPEHRMAKISHFQIYFCHINLYSRKNASASILCLEAILKISAMAFASFFGHFRVKKEAPTNHSELFLHILFRK